MYYASVFCKYLTVCGTARCIIKYRVSTLFNQMFQGLTCPIGQTLINDPFIKDLLCLSLLWLLNRVSDCQVTLLLLQ